MLHFRCKTRFATAAAALALACQGAHASDCTPVPRAKIALQLYDMLALTQPKTGANAQDALSGTFAAIRQTGFRNVERFGGTLGIRADAYAAAANGLRFIGSHGPLDAKSWGDQLAEAKRFGQQYVGSDGFGPPGLDTLEHVHETARNLNARGREAAAKGLRLYVHNHGGEFTQKFSDAGSPPVSAWEIVAANTDPQLVAFEIDVHWARQGFGLGNTEELLAFLRKYAPRIVMLHVKDTAADGSIADLGRGTTDWPRVFAAAGSGVRYYIWEYDNPPDPTASAQIAYRYLTCGK
jgi:sugar phosphate isomerase/epimerase